MDHVMLVPTSKKLTLPTSTSPLASLQTALNELNRAVHLSEEERWDRYRSIFQTFFAFTHAPKSLAPSRPKETSPVDPLSENLSPLFADKSPDTVRQFLVSLMTTLPVNYQKRIVQLLQMLATSSDVHTGNVKFSSDGAMILQGEVIPTSNLIDLLNFASRVRKGVSKPPVGWDQFVDFMVRANVPRELYHTSHSSTKPTQARLATRRLETKRRWRPVVSSKPSPEFEASNEDRRLSTASTQTNQSDDDTFSGEMGQDTPVTRMLTKTKASLQQKRKGKWVLTSRDKEGRITKREIPQYVVLK